MNVRTETIAKTFAAFLDRYSPPQAIRGRDDLEKVERDGLLRVLLKFAPRDGYDRWVDRALDKLEYQMKTRAWPTKSELGSVCSNLRKDTAQSEGVEAPPMKTPHQIMADRISNGKPIGDEWLYGRRAVELLTAGLVGRDDMRRYRSQLYFSMKDVWGEDVARQKEAALIRKHEDAEGVFRDPPPTPPTSEPFQRFGGDA